MADGLLGRAGAGLGPGGVARLFAGGTVLCDGAMGTMLYARGVFINRCYDELNLSQPETGAGGPCGVSAGWRGGDGDQYVWRECVSAGALWAAG